jgi:hypothetical protein
MKVYDTIGSNKVEEESFSGYFLNNLHTFPVFLCVVQSPVSLCCVSLHDAGIAF